MERASWVAAGLHRRDVAAAALGQRLAGALQQFGVADDGGERGAQLVGDVADEVALQPLGLGQRRCAVGQRALQLAGVGDVGEGDQGRAVRQRAATGRRRCGRRRCAPRR